MKTKKTEPTCQACNHPDCVDLMMQGFTDASLDDAPAWGTKAEVDVSAVRVGEYLRSLGFCDRHETDLLKKMVDHMTRSLPS